MPLAFPSHQGLILPLWRRWPHRFDAVALSIGAAMPDIVDALAWPIRGELGQGIGHSLIGVVVLSTPLGFALTLLARKKLPRSWIDRLSSDRDRLSPKMSESSSAAMSISIVMSSVGVGALSHVLFDLVTHANFVLLLPWYQNDELFPAWWRHVWFELPLFVYRKPYPIGPHFIVWVVLSVVGVVLFVRCLAATNPKRSSLEQRR